MRRKKIKLTQSQFTEKFLYLNGQPFSFKNYEFMPIMYDIKANKKIFKFSRQTAKSTSVANMLISYAAMHPHSGQLYVSPSADQTKIFSNDRVGPVIETSPLIKKYYINSTITQNVFTKKFLNHAKVYLRYAQISPDRLRGMCLSNSNEYNTLRGWVPVDELTEDDLVLTKNEETNEFEYQKPTRIINEPYNGNIHIFKSKGFKLEVTPEHRMHINFDVRGDHTYADKSLPLTWQTDYRAKNLLDRNFKMGLGDGFYKGESPSYFELPEIATNLKADGTKYADGKIRIYKSIKIPIKEFMTWFGWWLAEGWTAKNSVAIGIAQSKKSKHYKELKQLIESIFPDARLDNESRWILNSNYRTLYEWLKPLGKSWEKYIPREMLEYTDYLPDLLDALYKGDGDNADKSYRKNANYKKNLRLNTASKKLADSVQEAWIRLGKIASIRTRNRNFTKNPQGTISKARIIYTVEVRSKNYMNFYLNRDSCSGTVENIEYSGNIYCVTVPNGNFVVRDSEEKLPIVTGNSVDKLYWDECQDQNPDNIPIVEQAMSRSMVKESVYTGTPKRTKGTLAELWYNSTMYEWIPKCEHCGEWNFIDERIIGDTGPICYKCGKHLNTRKGQWVYTGPKDATAVGFRVSLPMFADAPWVDWQRDVIDYRKSLQTDAIFFNEVLGLEYDTGVTPVTIADLKKCCTGGPMSENPKKGITALHTTLGLDYGPVNSNKSKTVVSVVQYQGKIPHVLYLKKYEGPEADYFFIHQDIPRLYYKWHAAVVGADAGLGDGPNSEIRNRIGDFNRLVAFRYSGSLKQKGKWNPGAKEYTISRNITMTELFTRIKKQQIVFPRWEDFEPFADDFLNIAIEYDKTLGTYKYVNDGPDDSVHSILFGELAYQLLLRGNDT